MLIMAQSIEEAAERDGSRPFRGIQRMNSGEVCIICFERKVDTVRPCAHEFCSSCVEDWSDSSDSCPICRAETSLSDMWHLAEQYTLNDILVSMICDVTGFPQA